MHGYNAFLSFIKLSHIASFGAAFIKCSYHYYSKIEDFDSGLLQMFQGCLSGIHQIQVRRHPPPLFFHLSFSQLIWTNAQE